MTSTEPTTTPRFHYDPDGHGALLDGKGVAEELRSEAREQARGFEQRTGRRPGLVAVLVGDDPGSQLYVASKTKGCEDVGMRGETLRLPATISEHELLGEIERLNRDDAIDGVLVQQPLPKTIALSAVQSAVDPDKDVDGLHPLNGGKLWAAEEAIVPATPAGIIELLDRYDVPLDGTNAVVVGRSAIVGRPMAALLLQRNCTVTICHSHTNQLAAVCRRADVLVAAVGRMGLIGPDHVRDGAIVIDVGTSPVRDQETLDRLFPHNERKRRAFAKRGSVLAGDVDFDRVRDRAAAITPVPGGVGPLTVAMVLVNTLRCAIRREAAARS